MKKNIVISVILAVTLASSGVAFAQGNSGHKTHDRGEQPQRHDQDDRHDDKERHSEPRDSQGRSHNNDRWLERGAGPNHDFRKGQRLPDQYRHKHYVVDDWRGHHLRAPPRGYHWVQTGGDYVLVAIASGIILQIFLNN